MVSFVSKKELLSIELQKEGFSGVLQCINKWKNFDVFSPYKIENNLISIPQYYILVNDNITRRTSIEEFQEMEMSKFYSLSTKKELEITSFCLNITNFVSAKELYKYTSTDGYSLAYEKCCVNAKDKDIIYSKKICLFNKDFEKQLSLLISDWKYTNYNYLENRLEQEIWDIVITYSNNEQITILGNIDMPKEYKQIKMLLNKFLDINNIVTSKG